MENHMQLPSPKKGTERPRQFSANFYCPQTAGRIKMPLGMEVGLGPGDFVLDGTQLRAPLLEKGAEPQIFGQCLLWPNGSMYQDTTWYGGSLSLGDIVLGGDPAPPPLKGRYSPPIFG